MIVKRDIPYSDNFSCSSGFLPSYFCKLLRAEGLVPCITVCERYHQDIMAGLCPFVSCPSYLIRIVGMGADYYNVQFVILLYLLTADHCYGPDQKRYQSD